MMENKISELFTLYNSCFPDYNTTFEIFRELTAPEKAETVEERDGSALVGYSLIHEGSISLLCVDERYRRRGIGSRLLSESERIIRKNGCGSVTLGGSILQGVPVEGHDAVSFFSKRGYSAEWTSANMGMFLDEFDADSLKIYPAPEGTEFRIARPEEKASVLRAVEDAEPDWTVIFEDCADPVMIARRDGETVGFLILGKGRFHPEREAVGSVGCVGVVHAARRKGTGLRMVAEGCRWLKDRGYKSVELRYVELVDWYSRIGFEVTGHQWMGGKTL